VSVRVLRLLEYTYDNNVRAEEDMARWQVPPIGTRRHGDMTVRSAIITDLNFEGNLSESQVDLDNVESEHHV